MTYKDIFTAVLAGVTTLTPMQTTYSATTTAPKGVVVLDPGHGMNNRGNGRYDPGAIGGGVQEADIVLDQARKIKDILEKDGYEVLLTRSDNKTPTTLGARSRFSNEHRADAYVSLHCNAAGPSAEGFEVYGNAAFAEDIDASLAKHLPAGTRNRGVKNADFQVLRNTKAPSVLVESGFITNDEDRTYLTDAKPDVEEGIAEAIEKYLSDQIKADVRRTLSK